MPCCLLPFAFTLTYIYIFFKIYIFQKKLSSRRLDYGWVVKSRVVRFWISIEMNNSNHITITVFSQTLNEILLNKVALIDSEVSASSFLLTHYSS